MGHSLKHLYMEPKPQPDFTLYMQLFIKLELKQVVEHVRVVWFCIYQIQFVSMYNIPVLFTLTSEQIPVHLKSGF